MCSRLRQRTINKYKYRCLWLCRLPANVRRYVHTYICERSTRVAEQRGQHCKGAFDSDLEWNWDLDYIPPTEMENGESENGNQ